MSTTTYTSRGTQNGAAQEYAAASIVHGGEPAGPAGPRRLRGLRFPVLPSGAWLAQLGGGLATLGGVYLAAGVAATLITGGVAAVVLGALREAGKV